MEASSHVTLYSVVESTQRVYGVRLCFVSARTNKRHHHQQGWDCKYRTGKGRQGIENDTPLKSKRGTTHITKTTRLRSETGKTSVTIRLASVTARWERETWRQPSTYLWFARAASSSAARATEWPVCRHTMRADTLCTRGYGH